jgi:predicted nucleic acid-binding Zn ribbon protein
MAQSIGSVIQEWLRKSGLEEKVQQQRVPAYWEEIVGETIAGHCSVERVDRGRMFIAVTNATWRNEIMLRRDEIRRRVNEHLGAEVVKEVIVR